MKVQASVKKICRFCRVVRRRGGKGSPGGQVVRVVCTTKKHNQRQG